MRNATGLWLMMALTACAAEKSPAPEPRPVTPAAAPVRAGTLQLVSGTLRFLDCGGTGEGVTVNDRPDDEAAKLIAEFAPADGRLTAVVRIERDSLLELRYAGLEGPRCAELPPEGVLSASGTEPFWHLRIGGDSATLTTPEASDGIVWAGGKWDPAHLNHRRFVAQRDGGDTLAVALSEERCADGMSGARYPWRVTITQRGTTMSGCALEGRNAGALVP